MIVEYKRLTKTNALAGSPQGESWWLQVEEHDAPYLGFAPEGVRRLRDLRTGELTLVYDFPTVLPLFFRDPSVFTSDLDLTEDFW